MYIPIPISKIPVITFPLRRLKIPATVQKPLNNDLNISNPFVYIVSK
jgi:hypothetical protein